MKQLNKLLALALAVIMVMALATTAFAATITVNSAVPNQTYRAYKIFDVTVADTSGTEQTYAYTIDSKLSDGTTDNPWYSVVNTYAQTTSNGLTLTKVGDSSVYNVSVDNTFSAASFAAALSAELAKDTTKQFTASGTATATQGQATTIDVSESGYYFVDSSVGALCVLNTVTDNFIIYEKNSLPTIEKKVQEDSKTTQQDGGWGDSATADIGQTVQFKLTVNTGTNNAINIPQIGTGDNESDAGVDKNYVIEDTMTQLTYTGNTHDGTTNASGEDTAATVAVINGNTNWTIGTDFTVAWNATNKKLTIILKAGKLDNLPQDTEITVTYGAKLDEDAVVGTDGNNSNKNTVKLTYGTYSTAEDTTTVKTYQIDVYKFHKTGEDDAATKNALKGAKFTLSNKTSADGVDTFTPLYFKSPTTGTTPYVHNSSITAATTGYVNEITTDDTGKFSITGLDAGTYYLTETAAPNGFNQLKDRIEVTVGEDGSVTYKLPDTQNAVAADTQDGILVENKAGALLPSTGGIGTTIFYVVGGILVVGAGVLLITKKRMNNSK